MNGSMKNVCVQVVGQQEIRWPSLQLCCTWWQKVKEGSCHLTDQAKLQLLLQPFISSRPSLLSVDNDLGRPQWIMHTYCNGQGTIRECTQSRAMHVHTHLQETWTDKQSANVHCAQAQCTLADFPNSMHTVKYSKGCMSLQKQACINTIICVQTDTFVYTHSCKWG